MMLINGRPQKPFSPCAVAEAHGVTSPTLESFDLLHQIMELEKEISGLERVLIAATERCLYRQNDVCDTTCGCRPWCEREGLKDV